MLIGKEREQKIRKMHGEYGNVILEGMHSSVTEAMIMLCGLERLIATIKDTVKNI
jgi:hypothetical protein